MPWKCDQPDSVNSREYFWARHLLAALNYVLIAFASEGNASSRIVTSDRITSVPTKALSNGIFNFHHTFLPILDAWKIPHLLLPYVPTHAVTER